ncbi:hypothetical protein V2J09_022832 [Rumex salicifolius]
MSILPKDNIEVIAQSTGINNLSQDGALALALDEATKCMRHSRRTKLTTDDVDTALSVRNVEPIYGFASGDPLRFRRAGGHKDLFYINDKDMDFKDVIEAPLPKVPLDTSIACHWLAIDGVQPAIPENAPVKVISAPDTNLPEIKDEENPVDIKLPIKHVLSRELQLYFDKITELVVNSSESGLFKQALTSLATDPGLHPLVPYFTCFIADEVSRGLGDFRLLVALMRLLHQLMPCVVTCLVAKRLGNRFADDHWKLRDFSAKLPRLTKTLIKAFLDPKRSITQHYGAIQGLAALGPNVVRLLILPNLEPYMRLLEPEMHIETQNNEAKRHEAWTVYGALLHAAGQCIHDSLKLFPAFHSRPADALLRDNARILTTTPGKRKASMEHLEHQRPVKRAETDCQIDATAMTISPSNGTLKADKVADSAHLDNKIPTTLVPNQMIEQPKRGNQLLKISSVLDQIWKDELKSGQVLASTFSIFGESVLPFISVPEIWETEHIPIRMAKEKP